jgi:hypothetical protein
VLRISANEELYAAWQHIAVDEYPCVVNFDEVQQQLHEPDFLREVNERCLANTTKSDYESWGTFKDGTAYALMVGETGDVINVVVTGSSVYSHGLWEHYRPLLQKLRFTPGRIRGRGVVCRVLEHVDRTFVEDQNSTSN